MAIGSGLGSSAGFSPETSWGTYVAPTRFVRARSSSAQKTATRQQGEGIQAGSFGSPLSQYVETVTGGSGQLSLDIQSKGMGVLFQTLMGTAITPVQQGTSTAYLQTHVLADPYGKSMSVQVGLPQRGGTITPATLVGAKVTQAALTCAVDGLLQGTFDFDAKSYENTTTLASVSYGTGVNVFHGAQMSVKLGTYGSEAAVSGVKSVNVTIARPHDSSAYYAGATGVKAEPVLNAVTAITGSITVDFIDTATFHARVRDSSSTSLVLTWVGPVIASTYYETFTVTIPAVVFPSPESFNAADRNVLSHSFNFEARYDGTNAMCTVAITSAETTI